MHAKARFRSPRSRATCWKCRIDLAGAGRYIRAARRYGERPEIYIVMSAAARFALARTSLPDDAREAFEKRILSGEMIGHAEINARCTRRAASLELVA